MFTRLFWVALNILPGGSGRKTGMEQRSTRMAKGLLPVSGAYGSEMLRIYFVSSHYYFKLLRYSMELACLRIVPQE
jgi:hypothetical protein